MQKHTIIYPIITSFFSNQIYQFWFMQCIFWLSFSVISFLSLSLWYATANWDQTLHTLLQSIEGLALSIILHYIFIGMWGKSSACRILISLVAVILIATLWTIIRMLTFSMLIVSDDLWGQFGGWYFSSIFVFLCWSALYYGVRYYQLLQIEHRRTLTAENLAKESQLKMLRYQLNPHFLFNTLNAISALIKIDEEKKAQEMLQKLSKFLRFSLDGDPIKLITLEQEINALKLYLDIEKIRFDDRLAIHFDLQEDAKMALLPSLLLQPLVENSIKYAIAEAENGGRITILANIESTEIDMLNQDKTTNNKKQAHQKLNIQVIDSGPGMTTHTYLDDQHPGVGLKNIIERLQTHYKNQYDFVTTNLTPKGLAIQITIPYVTHL